MQRKDFFKKGLAKLLESAISKSEEIYETVSNANVTTEIKAKKTKNYSGLPKYTRSKPIAKGLKFPPGAVSDRTKFESLCNGCGDCITQCPYNVLFPVKKSKPKKDLPYLDPNLKACMLCKDWPCIQSCETGALLPLKKKLPNFGKAVSKFSNCVNFKLDESICTACLDSCPVPKAIKFSKNEPIFLKGCVGCGICVQSCPSFPKAIVID
ncbi:MAG: 4Fe-4S dicluster domain-containing protein [Leptospiraceae bacterium]|nr:4Fe-4S dicluster domain-containing protein [Leptospiraceae bacterium]MCK6379977.1 4Fe-4S dicluster domain-containing protein [Leptospiraceae bacterium]NUM40062.1 4Fe-4S dicluster domain-containing protein [Leptospiraceae bacterium]